MSALGGIVMSARFNSTRGDAATGMELDVITAVLLGGVSVFGGRGNEGAVIVSQEDYPVDFSRTLACRVGNIVPIDSVETAVRSVNAYTQTVGIYPETLKTALRDRLAFQGAQRIVSRHSCVHVARVTRRLRVLRR